MTMKSTSITSLLLILPLAACAPTAFRADAGAIFAHMYGGTSLQNTGGTNSLSAVQNNLRSSLDVGQAQAQPYLRLESDWGPQRFRVHGFRYDESGSGPLGQDFGDLPAGTVADTSLEYISVVGSWSYDLMPTETFRLGPGVQLGYYSLDVTARSTSPAGFETVTADVLMPELFVEAGVDLGLVSADANLGFMSASLGDAKGNYVDGEVMVRVHPSRQFEAFVGYRFTVLDAMGQASGRDFDADVTIAGFLIGGGIKF